MTEPNPCLAAALSYATEGLHVFPAKPGEKKSRLSMQYAEEKQAWGMTRNPDTVRKYWRQFPDSNVCIVTGSINGLFVVETDTADEHGKDGAAELKKLVVANGYDWPDTKIAESPSGSKHYYFTWPDDDDVVIINSDGKLAPGIDVRAEGGMVVAPPSYAPKHDGRYKWISDPKQGVVKAPAWLIRLLAQKPPKKHTGEPQADIEKIRAAMELIPNDIPDESWEVSDYKTGEINTRIGWEGWNTIAMALYRATAGSDAAYAIFKNWCAKNKTKFDEKYTYYTWYSRYRRSPPKTVGAGTLFTIAETYSPGWSKIWDEEHIEEIIEVKIEEAKINKTKYKIKLRTGTNANLRELEAFMPNIYVYGNRLVYPIIKINGSHNTKTAELIDETPEHLGIKAKEHIIFEMIKAKKTVIVEPPTRLTKELLSQIGEWKFPLIKGVMLTPIMRPDGSLFINPGYDPVTRLLMIEPIELPPIPNKSSKGDAYEAIELLENLIIEFSFVDPVAKAVALAALITPVVRGSFQMAPMFVGKAPTPASGKSYLFDLVSAIAIGQRMPTTAAGANNEETEKRLSASLLAGQPLISIDNVNGELGGDALCQYLERPVVNVRVLGKSENRRIETEFFTMFATGNNLTLTGDITRRALICSLDLNEEHTESHQYKNDPYQMVMNNRGKYVAACLTICRAYIQAGLPGKLPKLASYEGWSDIVRSAIVWLGRADAVDSMKLGRAEDPTMIDLENMLTQWGKVIGIGEPTALPLGKVMEIAVEKGKTGYDQYVDAYPEFHDAIYRIASIFNREPDLKRLTNWARHSKGRIINGLKLVNHIPPKGGLAKWWVQNADDPRKESPGLRENDKVIKGNFAERK